jgi:integrase
MAKTFPLLRLTDLVRHPDGRVTIAEATAETEQDAAALRALLGETTAAGNNPAGAASTPPDSGMVLVAWVADHKDGWTEKTRQEAESHVQRYLDFAGVEWSVRAKVAAYKTGPLAALAARTRSKHLTRIEHFFRWAVAHGYLADNPATGIRPRMRSKIRPADERPGLTVDEARKVLATADPARDAREWLPVLALYTGARINELAQLRPEDVTDAMRITAKAGRLKNGASERRIPVHGELVRRGFLEYVDARRAAGAERIFDFKQGRDGHGQAASRWYGRWRKQRAKLAGSDVAGDFHSLRHTVASRLREALVPESIAAEILGHSRGKLESYGRYASADAALTVLAAELAKVAY